MGATRRRSSEQPSHRGHQGVVGRKPNAEGSGGRGLQPASGAFGREAGERRATEAPTAPLCSTAAARPTTGLCHRSRPRCRGRRPRRRTRPRHQTSNCSGTRRPCHRGFRVRCHSTVCKRTSFRVPMDPRRPERLASRRILYTGHSDVRLMRCDVLSRTLRLRYPAHKERIIRARNERYKISGDGTGCLGRGDAKKPEAGPLQERP